MQSGSKHVQHQIASLCEWVLLLGSKKANEDLNQHFMISQCWAFLNGMYLVITEVTTYTAGHKHCFMPIQVFKKLSLKGSTLVEHVV